MTIYVNERDCWTTQPGLSWPSSKQRLVLSPCWGQNWRPRVTSGRNRSLRTHHSPAASRREHDHPPGLSGWLCNVPQNRAGLYKHSCFPRQKYFHSSLSIRQGTCFPRLAVAETNPQGGRELQLQSPAAPLRKTAQGRPEPVKMGFSPI